MNGYLSRQELLDIGFASVGEDVSISNRACFYGASKMHIGNHVRIDDFCLLVGNITIGNHVHICAYSTFHASAGSIVIDDFSGFSVRTTVYAASDDYSGETMSNPTVPEKYKAVETGDVYFGKHTLVGAGSTFLHKTYLPEGNAIGSMTLVNGRLEPWGIYAGIPCRRIKDRSKHCLELERQLIEEESQS